MIRDRLRALALAGAAAHALGRARRLVRDHPDAIAPMLTPLARPATAPEWRSARAVARAIAWAARWDPRATCLIRAVAAHEILLSRGVRTTLRIGPDAPAGARFSAHAWLELDGVPIVGDARPETFEGPPAPRPAA